MSQSKTVVAALQQLRALVRFRSASFALTSSDTPYRMSNDEDTRAIVEATRSYVESWIVPLIDAIENDDKKLLKQLITIGHKEVISERAEFVRPGTYHVACPNGCEPYDVTVRYERKVLALCQHCHARVAFVPHATHDPMTECSCEGNERGYVEAVDAQCPIHGDEGSALPKPTVYSSQKVLP